MDSKCRFLGSDIWSRDRGGSDGAPFAVSNRCRDVFAPLGEGSIEPTGELTCPWHAARFGGYTDAMVRSPLGVFKLVANPVKATLGAAS
jgi:nitrite reductase/ring-hydroxylating ferredoxin subunit